MIKFFIVGKKYLLLGRESKKNIFKFTIGKTLKSQVDFAEVSKIKNIFCIQKILNNKTKYDTEGINLLLKTLEKNFNNRFFIDKEFFYTLKKDNYSNTNKNKYNKLTDVYDDPHIIPWNFVPTEIEDILSHFKKTLLKHKNILYIGAGYGKNIWAIQEHNYNIDAIEFSKLAVNRANKIFGKKVISQKNLLNFYGYKGKKYDIIIDIGCIHSIPTIHREKAIKNIHNLLKENGILVSRIFKPRNKMWVNRMPFKIDKFGLTKNEIRHLFHKNFVVKNKYENIDYILLEIKKC